MIFAEIIYEGEYGGRHGELLTLLSNAFNSIESGHQGDSYIWVLDGAERVAVDTFTSMRHQVKSPKPGSHVQAVIDVLSRRYELHIYEQPELEAHED